MQFPPKGYIALFLATCWMIAICNWLGIESFSSDKYELWKTPVLLSRIVVVVSVAAGMGYAILWIRNR